MPLSYSELLSTPYGLVIAARYDINQTEALRRGSAFNHSDIVKIADIAKSFNHPIVYVDIGANLGLFTLGVAKELSYDSRVYAFEPQRILYNMICGSIALNGYNNIWCYNAAVGSSNTEIEIPQYDYNKTMNFGSVEFTREQKEGLHQVRGNNPRKVEYVTVYTLDSFKFERLDLLKIDVEGMESDVLTGAIETIKRCKPIMFIEWLKSDKSALENTIRSLGYTIEDLGNDFLCRPIVN